MKKIIALFLAILLLAGCSANKDSETPSGSDMETVTTGDTEVLDTPMTEEEAAAAEEAKAAELEERAKSKSMPLGTFSATTLTEETVDESVFAQADLTVIYIWATYLEDCQADLEKLPPCRKKCPVLFRFWGL